MTDAGGPNGETTVAGLTIRTWLGSILLPVALGTVVYWLIADTSIVELAVFAVMMVVVLLALDYFFDTIPDV